MAAHILGVDIGATKISTGLVTLQGHVSEQRKFATEVRYGKRRIIRNLEQTISSYPRSAYRAIGIGIMGSSDWRKGISRSADKLPRDWHDVPLGSIVRRACRKPVSVDNDANAFTLGVAIKEARGYAYVVGLTLGSGIGGGFVINRAIYHGRDNWVSEIGHTIIDSRSALVCSCGHRGHLETVSSGWGISKRYTTATGRVVTPFDIEKAAKNSEKVATAIFRDMAHGLGVGLANIVASFNPEVIAVGGGLSRFAGYVDAAGREMRKHLTHLPVQPPKLIRIKNPEAANIRGAALLTIPAYHIQ